jgi:DNA-binding NtrC family response regulator
LLRWSIAELLRRSGHTVLEASTAAAAREAIGPASGRLIDVVLLDHRLPDSRDLQLLDDIRRQSPRSAVIVMTVYASAALVEEALERGAVQVLGKPFDMHGLEGLVTAVFRNRGRFH